MGSRSLIGNGATINHGVEDGEDSLIASGAMVIENMIIPSGSMVVGVPAKIRGDLKQRHIDLIKSTSQEYVKKSKLYLSESDLSTQLYD